MKDFHLFGEFNERLNNMITCLQTGAVLLAVLAIFTLEPCTAEISEEVTETNCPALTLLQCERGLNVDTHYIKVYSVALNTMFLCDTKTDGGGWIVIQRRVTKKTQFNQYWALYKNGFGPLCGDYWLGNRYIHQLTSSGKYELRFEIVHR
ncbi:Ficolin-1-A [Bulinus truncatus]|nr:Ficolin-1-A [Bulinus truncatus]